MEGVSATKYTSQQKKELLCSNISDIKIVLNELT